MKYLFILFLASFFSPKVWAQLAIIQDPDGFTHVREDQGVESKILDKIKEFEVFWVINSEDNQSSWRDVSFYRQFEDLPESKQAKLKDKLYMNRLWMYGYIHESRVRLIEDLPAVKQISKNDSAAEFSNGKVSVKITLSSFDSRNHLITRNDNWISEIDGTIPFGTDGEIPGAEVSSVSIITGNQQISIPKEMLKDLFLPNIKSWKASVFTGPKEELYIVMHNSDGAGYYDLVWVVKDGKVLARFAGTPY
ncbi:MAG: hypothetical protein SF052_24850 [Bacteroidia bacterium]|nr:hypothetical protein [Bacteroidia bacterium]